MPFLLSYGVMARRKDDITPGETTKNATRRDEITPRETTKRRNNAWPKDEITKFAARKDEKPA